MRRLLMSLKYKPYRLALAILSHLTPHTDILWHGGNWIPSEVREEARSCFVWSIEEIARMLMLVPLEEWERGGLGQCVYFLFLEDEEIEFKLRQAAKLLINMGQADAAFEATYLVIALAGEDGANVLERLIQETPVLGDHPLMAELARNLKAVGFLTLFD